MSHRSQVQHRLTSSQRSVGMNRCMPRADTKQARQYEQLKALEEADSKDISNCSEQDDSCASIRAGVFDPNSSFL